MAEEFKIRVGEQEGPLELLLELIESRKLQINQLSLAQVTDDYLKYLEKEADRPPVKLAEFLVVASTLILIKSRSLLPNFQLNENEKEEIGDLMTRLKLLQMVRERAQILGQRFGQTISFPRSPEPLAVVSFAPGSTLNFHSLRRSVDKLIAAWPIEPVLPRVILEKVVTLEEMINQLAQRLTQALTFKFSDFVAHYQDNKKNVIIGFLGLLELVKRGVVEVQQSNLFNEINIVSQSKTIPPLTL